MSQLIAPLRYKYQIVLGHPHEPRLLLLSDGERWQLPGFSSDERRFWQDVDHVNAALRVQLGASVITLRCLALDYQSEHELLWKAYAAIVHDPEWRPPAGARWLSPAEALALPLADESQRDLIVAWQGWHSAAPPSSRAPWYTPGWYDEAAAWATDELQRAGLPPLGPAEQLRSWQRSALLRLPTAQGLVYFKAVPPIFGHEPALTAALFGAAPGRFAAPVALDAERGWLLMRELPGPTLDALRGEEAVSRWEAALRAFAAIQIASAARLPELRALGVPERPLVTLADRLEPLLADPAAMLPGRPAGLSDDDRARLHAFAPQVRALADELAAYALPAALEHGDFWAGQVIVGERDYGFLDWSDSSISHPFFSLLLFLVELEDFFPDQTDMRERLRDAYLEPWAALAPAVDLVRAFELAQPLAALHHALSYHALVLPHMEVKWEMELMLPFYLKMALRLATA